ncbi:mannosyltransferase (pig-m) protein [Cystoisospora suis]|uniref:GPI mannosyltransferase 1 n=1 Tax=Cystoisospora suis TaxID=483139 RepID=A0A2C6K7R5_9APIC|nr:mannosyltransferase (pig-m) protein [Cystoisospora suis]
MYVCRYTSIYIHICARVDVQLYTHVVIFFVLRYCDTPSFPSLWTFCTRHLPRRHEALLIRALVNLPVSKATPSPLLSFSETLFRYGWPFIYESYLYHFVRVDIRHNFSLFFYLLYLTAQTPSKVLAFITFLPQVSLCLLVGCHYAQKGMIEFALFLQTLVFVALNKVCTTQYFLWWLCLLPFAIASTDMTSRRCWEVIGLLAFFQGTNFVWLYFGYAVEFKGKASFFQMFLSAILFTFSQFLLVWFFILHSKKKMSSSSSSHLSKKRKNERKTLQKTIPEDNNDAVKCARREKEKHF